MPETVKRTFETEEFTNLHFIHPISRWLVSRLSGTKITPNMVSLTGMMFGILAGISYYHYQSRYMVFAGFGAMIIWHILDGADGQLARLTGSHSELGKILDGFCDYITFISVYIGVGLGLSWQGGAGIWGVILFAGVLHAIQSSAYEMQRGEYDFWGHGREGAKPPEIRQMIADLEGKSFLSAMLNQPYIGYIRMQRRFSGISPELQHTLKDSLKNHPDKADDIRALYREIFAPSVRSWSIMCANYRTIAIFITCLAGYPLYFFWLEIAVLTPALIFLVRKQRLFNQLFSLRLKEII